ncbi:hypothetical protein CC78DRAFT_535816 [Lojkania enalia]|uniref:F-box domain-containing protein n=1 Tax=Lojkania enalia TaxID=147567 RepID=A0A9P4K304_9PLEO|nr:hypothetical protein CC78DRAFT_535816 [Didymosphaeria enalia]
MAFIESDFPPLRSQKPAKIAAIVKRGKEKANPAKKPQTCATLGNLPDELLLQILNHLPCLDLENFQLPSVVNLSLTNRRLHNVCLERLYVAYNSFFAAPYLFLRTMISNHNAAQMVHSMEISYGSGVHEDRGVYCPLLSDRRTIKAGLKELNIPGWKEWATDCNDEGSDQEILYAAILMHTPNIASLEVDDGELPYHIPKWVDLIRYATSGTKFGRMHSFQKLETITLDIGGLRLRNLAPLFRLPSLRKLTISGLVETNKVIKGDPFPFKWPIASGSSSIEELYLPNAFLDTAVITAILDSCRTLKQLQYDHRDDRWFYRQARGYQWWEEFTNSDDPLTFAPLSYPTLAKALHRHRNTLESLQFWDDIYEGIYANLNLRNHRIYRTFGHLGNLKGLEKLKTIKGTLAAFVDIEKGPSATLVENLPPSLTHICLIVRWDDRELKCMPSLEHAASYYRSHLPLLKEIRLEVAVPPSQFPYDWSKRIQGPLSKDGINVVVEQTSDILRSLDEDEAEFDTTDEPGSETEESLDSDEE